MSGLRLLATSAAMAAVAAVLHALAPDPGAAVHTLRTAQQVATTTGPDTVVVAAVGVVAWLFWGWGALGLALTAATALPGAAGTAARGAARVLLPASIRSSAAVALGVGLVVATPVLAQAAPAPTAASAGPAPDRPGAHADRPVALDWPASSNRDQPAVPDWPAAGSATPYVVVGGDCLWHIAAEHLRSSGDSAPTDRAIALQVESWWQANRAVIGPDPDLIHPGQVLQQPSSPEPTNPGEPR